MMKNYFKAVADVIEDIENMKATTEEKKEYNARMCFAVKMLIDGLDYAKNKQGWYIKIVR